MIDQRLYDLNYLLGWSAALETERLTFAEWADKHDHQTEGSSHEVQEGSETVLRRL